LSNQLILLSSIFLPWFTLFFMDKKDIKRYMPVALFGALGVTIIGEIALASNWWFYDSVYPFFHIPAFAYGLFPVGIIWIFKLTYKRFLLFMIANAIFDFILTFPLDYFLTQRGILILNNITNLQLLLLDLVHAVVLYVYQVWQESIFALYEETSFSASLQPAASKPVLKDQDANKDSE